MSNAVATLWLRRLIILLPPLILTYVEMDHPTKYKYDIFNLLIPQVNWWIQLHLIQLPLLGLIGVGLWLLTSPLKGWLVVLSRISIWSFLIFYSAYSGIEGIATGIIIRDAEHLPNEQQEIIGKVLQKLFNDPVAGGEHSWICELASLSWLFATCSAALALYFAGRGRVPCFLILLSGVFLYYGHPPPTGTIGFACFFIGASWLEFVSVPENGEVKDTLIT